MRVIGELLLAGNSPIKNLRIENLASDPGTPTTGQIWFNTTEGVYKGYDGTSIITFSIGGDVAPLQSEVNAIETGAGLNTDGTYTAPVGTNYLGSATSLKNADVLLDTQVKANADDIAALESADTTMQTEINAIETGAGLNTDGTFPAFSGSNYLDGASNIRQLSSLLDTQVKANADDIVQNTSDIALKVNKAGDTMTGNLAMGGNEVTGLPGIPTLATSAASKAYVDALISSSTTWKDPVVSPDLYDIVTAVPGSPIDGASYIAYGGSYPQTWGTITDVAQGDIIERQGSTWVRLGVLTAGQRFIAGGETGSIGSGLFGAGVRHVDLIQYASGAPTGAAAWTQPHADNNQAILFTNNITTGSSTGLANDATAYTMTVHVNGSANNVSVVGSHSQTIGDLITEINADLTGATASIVAGHLHITGAGATDTILITDGTLIAAIGGDTGTAGNGQIHGSVDPGTTVLCNTPNGDHLGHTYLFSGGASGTHNWVEIAGPGTVEAGIGLAYSGNVLNVNLGAGISQLPSDEVGIDLYTNGGLFLTINGTDPSGLTGAQLAVHLDGGTLSRGAAGLKVADAGVTETQLNASVAGAGLTGGAGVALAVGAGTGITVNANDVALDTTYLNSNYLQLSGGTLTGALILNADPTNNLHAATKQYVDAVRTALENSTYVYDGVTSQTTHVVTHNIGTQYCNVTVVDSTDKVIIPDSITFDSGDQLTIVFSSAITCKAVVTSTYVA